MAALAERHEVVLASLAGPDPADVEALDRLQALGIAVHAVWRDPPSVLIRGWSRVTRQAVPDPGEWARPGDSGPARPEVVPPERSPARRLERRLGQLRRRLQGREPLFAVQLWEPRMQRLLDSLLARGGLDVLQVDDGAMGGAYRPDHPIPSVLIEPEVRQGPALEAPPGAGWLQAAVAGSERRRWERYQPGVWRRFDRIQVFTERDAQAVASLAPGLQDRVRVNPFGVELPPPAEPGLEEDGSLVFVGGFVHPPNVDAAVWLAREILPAIRARRPGVRLTLVGSAPPPQVRALAGENVVVTGRVPSVEPYLERAAVVLVPVRLGGGMRLKVLQAMALGKAVVTTSLGAEGLAAAPGAPPLAVADGAEAIVEATVGLLHADEDRRALGERARAFVAEHHSWQAYGRRLEKMYAELSEGPREEAGVPEPRSA